MTTLSKNEQTCVPASIAQSIDWEIGEGYSDLFFRSHGIEILGGEIFLSDKAMIDFNTYFGSFYEDYWASHTSVKRIAIKLVFTGSLNVCLYREISAGRSELVSEHSLISENASEISIDIAAPKTQAGRVYFQVSGAGEGGRLIQASYMAVDSPKPRDISISLGICTFNREVQLMDNLKRLFSCESALRSIRRLIIVNQGEPFSDAGERIIAASPVEILLIEQENQGGTGGFTRTMNEAARTDDVTHHILMDDDIFLDPEVFTRTAQFLAFAHENVVIGGAAFNLEKPTICYEAGAQVQKNGILRLLAHNMDLAFANNLSVFDREKIAPDYNAWWFSVVPIKAIQSVQPPLSLFIRWDDIEYGLSLGENGFNTVCMPRIAVWHPPFNQMPEGWKTYYSIRNMLITSSIHPKKIKLPSRIRVFFWMAEALAKMDYQTAALIKIAIEDFTNGPDKLLSTSFQKIQARVAKTSKYSSVEVLHTDETPNQPPDSSVFTVRYFRVWLRETIKAIAIAANLFRHRKKHSEKQDIQLLEMEYWNAFMIGRSPYLLTNPERDFLWKFSPNPEISKQLIGECWKAARHYGKWKKDVSTEWKKAGRSRVV